MDAVCSVQMLAMPASLSRCGCIRKLHSKRRRTYYYQRKQMRDLSPDRLGILLVQVLYRVLLRGYVFSQQERGNIPSRYEPVLMGMLGDSDLVSPEVVSNAFAGYQAVLRTYMPKQAQSMR